MHYRTMQLLTTSRKETRMGLSKEELAEREAKAAKKIETKLDEKPVETETPDHDAQRDAEV
jgi:hypothetical protein